MGWFRARDGRGIYAYACELVVWRVVFITVLYIYFTLTLTM